MQDDINQAPKILNREDHEDHKELSKTFVIFVVFAVQKEKQSMSFRNRSRRSLFRLLGLSSEMYLPETTGPGCAFLDYVRISRNWVFSTSHC